MKVLPFSNDEIPQLPVTDLDTTLSWAKGRTVSKSLLVPLASPANEDS